MIEPTPLGPDPQRLRALLAQGTRPYVTLKAAATLDGKIATRSGESQWITGQAARDHAMRLRAGHDAVLVGRGTAQADDPRLTVRLAGLSASPARVLLDSRARIAPDARLLAGDGARRIVVVGSRAPATRLRALQAQGAEIVRCTDAQPRPAEFLAALRTAGVRSVLVEGGAQVHANLIAQGVADELFLYIAGRLIGDNGAPAWCGALGGERLADTPRVRFEAPQAIGADVLLHGHFEASPPAGVRH